VYLSAACEAEMNDIERSTTKRELQIKWTRESLWDALVSLIAERSYNVITVSDIVARAKINRATFYRYYEDKDDLFVKAVSNYSIRSMSSFRQPRQSFTI